MNSLDKVLPYIDFSNDCWLWMGRKNEKNYGTLKIDGNHRKAHTYVYELFVADVPEGLVLDHLCRTPPCVNPKHLEPVTRRENVLRGIGPAAKYAQRTHCSLGHKYTPENTRMRGTSRVCRMCCRLNYHRRKLQNA